MMEINKTQPTAANHTKIKICGLTRPEDIAAVNESKPDYIGFVFWPKSKRYVTREQAKQLRQELDPAIPAVGVFVDEEVDIITSLLKEDIIQIAQLHGGEDESQVIAIKEQTGKPVIKAIKLKSAEDLLPWQHTTADYLLLDGGMGDGKTFNWNLIPETMREKPFFLAGGLNQENIIEAINQTLPYAVDISSGVETDGYKDKEKIKQIIRSVRNE